MTAGGVERQDLPIPDYDHLPVGSLQGRVRTLDGPGIETLLEYERAHADRIQVVQMLERRREELDGGAPRSGGSPTARAPEQGGATATGSSVSPQTSGPPMNPPSQGDPTNPSQPRSTG
jgi:hypothetical protein